MLCPDCGEAQTETYIGFPIKDAVCRGCALIYNNMPQDEWESFVKPFYDATLIANLLDDIAEPRYAVVLPEEVSANQSYINNLINESMQMFQRRNPTSRAMMGTRFSRPNPKFTILYARVEEGESISNDAWQSIIDDCIALVENPDEGVVSL